MFQCLTSIAKTTPRKSLAKFVTRPRRNCRKRDTVGDLLSEIKLCSSVVTDRATCHLAKCALNEKSISARNIFILNAQSTFTTPFFCPFFLSFQGRAPFCNLNFCIIFQDLKGVAYQAVRVCFPNIKKSCCKYPLSSVTVA